jgi:hypothetical protein
MLVKGYQMENQNVVITNGNVYSNLVASRVALIKVASSTGEKIKTYADNLNATFNVVSATGELIKPWYELKGKDRQGLKLERDEFVKGMTEAGYSRGTIDVYWQRVKEASGYQTTGNRVSANLSTDDKTQADLKTIINRIFKAEEAGEDCKASEFKGDLMSIFEALGGNVDNLG